MTDAREFAEEMHQGMLYGDHPFIYHLDAVVGVLREFGVTNDSTLNAATLDAAFLHDVVEDAAVTIEEVEDTFGNNIAAIVEFCTDERADNRKARKALTYARMRRELDATPDCPVLHAAILVKLADRIANIRQCLVNGPAGMYRMYLKEKISFKEALILPPSGMSPIMKSMWAEYDRLMEVGQP